MSDPERSTVRCLRCNRERPQPTDTRGHRCLCGSFLPGNAARLRHGQRRAKDRVAFPPDLQQSISEFREQLVSDQGGLHELTAMRGGHVRLQVAAETCVRVAGNELTRQGGISTPGGRLAFDRLLAAIQTWVRVADKLGMERRTRQLPSPVEWMNGEVEP